MAHGRAHIPHDDDVDAPGNAAAASSSRRKPLFITLAQHALARGQHVAAAIRLLEGVRRRPSLLTGPARDAFHDEILGALAYALTGPGLEQELLDVDACVHGFLDEVFAALEAIDKPHVVAEIRRALIPVKRENTRRAYDRADSSDTNAALTPQAAPVPEPRWESTSGVSLHRPPTEPPLASYFPASLEPAPRRFATVTPVPAELLDEPDDAPSWGRWFGPEARDDADPRHAPLHAADDERDEPDTAHMTSATDGRQVPVALSRAWLEARLASSDVAVPSSTAPGTRDADAPSVDDDGGGDDDDLFGVDRPTRARLAIHRMSTAEDLLSHAACAADEEGSRRRRRTYGLRKQRQKPPRRRRLSIGLLVVALVCAAAALLPIAWDSLSDSWHASAVENAESQLSLATREGLLEARATLIDELTERPERASTAGLALLVDRLLVHRYGADAILELDALPAGVRDGEPMARVAQVLDALAARRIADARTLVTETPDEVWARRPGSRAWASGLVAAASGDVSTATRALDDAVGSLDLGVLPALDLADHALRTSDEPAIAALAEHVRAGRVRHPFLTLALRLAASAPAEVDANGVDAVLAVVTRPDSLSLEQQGWYWLARGYRALDAGQLSEASDDVARGLDAAPTNARLMFLSGLVALHQGRVTFAAAAMTSSAVQLADTARGRRHRADAVAMFAAAGRPDLVLQMLSYSATEPIDALMRRFSGGDRLRLVEALVALGRDDEALRVARAGGATPGPRVLLRLATGMLALGHGDAALEQVQAARSAETLEIANAVEAIVNGRFEDALGAAEQLTTRRPDAFAALELRAELMSAAHMGEEAALLVEERTVNTAIATRARILATLFRGRAGQVSTEDAEAVIGLEVTDLSLQLAQAEIALLAGLSTRAHTLLDAVAAVAPGHPRLAALRGVHLERGRHEERLALLRGGRQGHLSLPGLYRTLGEVHAARGEVEAAQEAWLMAMQRPGQEAPVVAALTAMYDTDDLRKAGRRTMTTLFHAVPQTPATRRLRGEIAYGVAMLYRPTSGNYESARFLKRARLLLGERPEVLFHLGQYFVAHDMDTLALKFFEQAHAIDPSYNVPVL